MDRRFGSLTVRIDRDLCVGFGDCIDVAPELFELDDDGVAVFRAGVTDANADLLRAACTSCPVDALALFDEAGVQIAP